MIVGNLTYSMPVMQTDKSMELPVGGRERTNPNRDLLSFAKPLPLSQAIFKGKRFIIGEGVHRQNNPI